MRSLILAFAVALSFAAVPAWGRADDFRGGDFLVLSTLSDPPGVPAPPPAPPAVPQPPAAAAQPCEGIGQAPACTPSPFDGDCCTRPLMLGSLCGVRDQLAAKGITFNVDTYQFYQGVASGGITDNFRYAGRNDYFINIDGEKAGLWKGFFIT